MFSFCFGDLTSLDKSFSLSFSALLLVTPFKTPSFAFCYNPAKELPLKVFLKEAFLETRLIGALLLNKSFSCYKKKLKKKQTKD